MLGETEQRLYFLVPTTTNPPDGPIRLGSVIRSPDLPTEPLLHASRSSDLIPKGAITITTESVQSFTAPASKTSSHGPNVNLFELFKFGVKWENHKVADYVLRNCVVETQEFDPWNDLLVPLDYSVSGAQGVIGSVSTFTERLSAQMQHAQLSRLPWSNTAYIITGIKIVRSSSSLERNIATRKGWDVDIGVPMDLIAVAPAGAEVGTERIRETQTSSQTQSVADFVCAYRVRKMKWTSRKKKISYGAMIKGGQVLGVEGHQHVDGWESSDEEDDNDRGTEDEADWEEGEWIIYPEDLIPS